MKRMGRFTVPLTKTEIAMVEEYLNTNQSLKEVSAKYGISDGGLRYKVQKYRKEQQRDLSTLE